LEAGVVQKDMVLEEGSLQDATSKKIIWLVCESCNRSQQVKDTVGNPARYFDNFGCQQPDKPNHDMIVNGARRKFPLVTKHQDFNV
jgi:hypothetical protein